MRETPSTRDGPGRALVLFVVATSVALVGWLSFMGRSDVLLYGDEHLSVGNLDASWGEILGLYDKRGTGVAFLVLQKLAVELFGAGPFAYRLPATLAALAAVALTYPALRRSAGPTAALLATPLLATTSLFLHYARFARAYSLLVLLILVFAGALERALRAEAPRRRTLILIAIAGALLPWVHLTASAPVLAAGATAIVVAAVRGDRSRALALAASLAGAGLLALVLFLPAREPMLAFIRNKAGEGAASFGAFDVAALLVGSRALGFAGCLVVALAALAFALRRRSSAAVTLALAAAPIVAVWLAKPAGGVYAFARYLIAGLPFYALLLAWLFVELARRVPALRERPGAQVGLGTVLLALFPFATGPILRDPAAFGPFANTNASLLSLPAFDVPYPDTPEFYRQLARSPDPVTIVEVPEQISRSILLYRNYWLQHGKDVSIGYVLARDPSNVPRGPYARIDAQGLASIDADYLVLHTDVQRELFRYWRFVQTDAKPLDEDSPEFPFMQAHGNFGRRFENRAITVEGLDALGEPFYTDAYLTVWKLR